MNETIEHVRNSITKIEEEIDSQLAQDEDAIEKKSQDLKNIYNNRISQEQIESLLDRALIQECLFHGKQLVTSYCLPNTFCILGTSSCVDPKAFNLELGRQYCRQEAIGKLWELEGYVLTDLLNQE